MIRPVFLPLEDIFTFPYVMYAHTGNGKRKETLQEHTRCCEIYFKKIFNERNIERPLIHIAEAFDIQKKKPVYQLYFEMLFQVISLHDIGKISPAFQKEKMDNELPKSYKIKGLTGSRHSLLSAIIYLNHNMYKINEVTQVKEEQTILRGFCLINAYVISRHHSKLGSFSNFLEEFDENSSADIILQEMKGGYDFLKDRPYTLSHKYCTYWRNFQRLICEKESITIYVYTRFMYSLLVSCDYYATTEHENDFEMQSFGTDREMESLVKLYEKTDLLKSIRSYQKGTIHLNAMNQLRSDIFLEVERNLQDNPDTSIYFLEAPTGSGKSNTSMNLSFQLVRDGYKKIYYVYPFNTLVEQNLKNLKEIFGEGSSAMNKVTVLNSNTPIKREADPVDEGENDSYIKALLDRQFLNYPFVLTTHVSLFETMFGNDRESAFGFSQLQDSVIVLDEIQSYKNTIWSEIIFFLKTFAKVLNMKVIIMSATLPDLTYLIKDNSGVVRLLKSRDKYFNNPLFKNRVKISYELLDHKMELNELADHVASQDIYHNKILIEFITKKTAYKFCDQLKEDYRFCVPIYLITGDNNIAERDEIIDKVKAESGEGLILISTQVIEAGVDIDMDIGYKDISKLDSEEQFMGRINRSCKRTGIIYFFDMDSANTIYKSDYRMNKELTLKNEDMKTVLEQKKFDYYYQKVMQLLKQGMNESLNDDENIVVFFRRSVGELDFEKVSERMTLIDQTQLDMPIFLVHDTNVNGQKLSGLHVWEKYKEILQSQSIPFAEKQVRLSEVRSKANYFIYKIKQNSSIQWNERLGELYCIYDGDKYFDADGNLNMKKLEEGGSLFLEL